jgi:hypothetical protein
MLVMTFSTAIEPRSAGGLRASRLSKGSTSRNAASV